MKKPNEKTDLKNTEPHYCVFMWLGMHAGPAFIQTDKNGKFLNNICSANVPLTNEFLDFAEGKFDDCKTFGDAANKFAEERGWTVLQNQYDSKSDKYFANLFEADGSNISAKEIREKFAAGVVKFKYKKVDKPAKINKRTGEVTPAVTGEVVEHFGTLNHDLIQKTIGQVEKAQAKNRIPNDSVIVYFDIHAENSKTGVAGDWRCFRLDHFQGFID